VLVAGAGRQRRGGQSDIESVHALTVMAGRDAQTRVESPKFAFKRSQKAKAGEDGAPRWRPRTSRPAITCTSKTLPRLHPHLHLDEGHESSRRRINHDQRLFSARTAQGIRNTIVVAYLVDVRAPRFARVVFRIREQGVH